MKLIFKNIVITLILLSCLLMQGKHIMASDDIMNLDESSDTRKILDTVGLTKKAYDILEGEDIIIGTTKTTLYKVFKSNTEALTSLSKENVITDIKEKYKLPALSHSNWMEYYNTILSDYEISPSEYEKIMCFFDIYENEEKNVEIKEAVREIRHTSRIFDESELAIINDLLPYTSKQIGGEDKTTHFQARAKGLSYVKMKAYANKWAYSYNPAFPNYANGDCTNFVSQIINAGGRKENVSWGRGMKTFYNADRFAKYFGVRIRTNSLQKFSSSLRAGDVALLDSSGDGSYNHAGFVYDIGTYKKYGNKYYTDFKIAQHSPGWIAWASSSTNNWETSKGYWSIMTIYQ